MRPGMSDGRSFTSYVSSCQMNAEIQKKYNLSNDTKYREFLQKNPQVITPKKN